MPEKPKSELGSAIVMVMRERGMTQKETAVSAGITEAALSEYISGKREPNLKALRKIAGALTVSPALLLCRRPERFDMTMPCWNKGDREC